MMKVRMSVSEAAATTCTRNPQDMRHDIVASAGSHSTAHILARLAVTRLARALEQEPGVARAQQMPRAVPLSKIASPCIRAKI